DSVQIAAEADLRGAIDLADAGEHAGGVREIGVVIARALPGDRPAADLVRDVVGALADHQHPAATLERQHVVVVLEQHQRLAHGAARQWPVLQPTRVPRTGTLRGTQVERADLQLGAYDAAHRVVNPAHGNLAGLHLAR